MTILLAVAAGGAVGAVSRYLTSAVVSRAFGAGFPYGTFAVNILGSLIMGFVLVRLATSFEASPSLKALITAGFLGSFTTFSTFSMDSFALIQSGAFGAAAAYILLSVGIGLASFWAGALLGQAI